MCCTTMNYILMKCYVKEASLSDKLSVSDRDRSRREIGQQIYSLQRQKSLTSLTHTHTHTHTHTQLLIVGTVKRQTKTLFFEFFQV